MTDRPGHDRRYAIDARKIEGELGWRAQENFSSGMRKTVEWYLSNTAWVADVTSGAYRQGIEQNYAGRTQGSERSTVQSGTEGSEYAAVEANRQTGVDA